MEQVIVTLLYYTILLHHTTLLLITILLHYTMGACGAAARPRKINQKIQKQGSVWNFMVNTG